MSGGVPVQQFDMDVLRAAEKGDPHPGSDRLGLDGKFGALLFELGDDPVDPVDTQADMLEPEIRRLRRRGHGLLGRNLRDENSHPPRLRSRRGLPSDCTERMISAPNMFSYQRAVASASGLRKWMWS